MRILVKVSGTYAQDERFIAFINRWVRYQTVSEIHVICGAGAQINNMLRHDFGWEPVYDNEGNRLTLRSGEWDAVKRILLAKAERLKKALPSRKVTVLPCISHLGEMSLPINGDILYRRLMSTGNFDRGFVVTKQCRLLKKAKEFFEKKVVHTFFVGFP